MLKVDLGQKTS